VTDFKNRLSHYLRLVKRGETVELLERNRPVARLSRVEVPATAEEDLLRRLQSDGIVTVPAGRPYTRLLAKPPLPCGGDAVRALIEERGDR
ncbi:MAG: type II toxin-antitoxin system prevent-host-death family antitoxin, partial [Planctomycetota bacterium]